MIADGTGEMANVITAEIQADNGVVHVIDEVLLPGTRPDGHHDLLQRLPAPSASPGANPFMKRERKT
jgi:hypothetical protein